jgi:uncharacterized protein DUF3606
LARIGTVVSSRGELYHGRSRVGSKGAKSVVRALPAKDYQVRYESKKTGKSKRAVKKAVKKVGSSRKKVERRLGGR